MPTQVLPKSQKHGDRAKGRPTHGRLFADGSCLVHPSPNPRPRLEQQPGMARGLDCWEGAYKAGCLATPRPPPTQAEKALFNAAIEGDLATLTRLVEEGVDLEATDNGDDEDQVSATSPASNRIPLWPSLHAASASAALTACVPPSPRVRRRASRPSCMRLTEASSTASTTSSPGAPTLRPQAR